MGIKYAFRYYWHSCSEFGTVHYFPTPEYFNCYVLGFYNASFNNPVGRTKLVLYMDNFDRKNDTETASNGVRLFFHKRNTFNDENMYFVMPGQKMYLDVSYSYIKQLPQPYGDCIEDPENKIIWTLNGRKLEYSKLGCQYAVYQRLKNYCCGCINENYPIIDFKIDTFDNLTSCRKISENYVFNYSCIDDETCSNAWDNFETVCPDVCENSAYHISISSFTWPDARDIVAFYKEYIAGRDFEYRFKRFLTNPLQLYKLISENFAKVRISFDLEEIVTFKDSPKFTFTSFISALGGLVNLYSGISFIIVIEIIDFCLNIFCKCCASRKQHSKVSEIKQ